MFPRFHEEAHIAWDAHYERYVEGLQDECHVHVTVNHSLNFVEPDTGALHRKSSAHGGLPRTIRTKDHYNSYLTE